jgi:hypothetical protein
MEKNMFPLAPVAEQLDKFVAVKLYTDRDIQEDRANAKLQDEIAKVATLPVYVIVSPDGKPLRVFQGMTRDQAQFLTFLKDSSAAVAQR